MRVTVKLKKDRVLYDIWGRQSNEGSPIEPTDRTLNKRTREQLTNSFCWGPECTKQQDFFRELDSAGRATFKYSHGPIYHVKVRRY